MDGTLTFHIGLMMRMWAREDRASPARPESQLSRTWRQLDQAREAQDKAKEAEGFQAVGMRCRETLVSFGQALASDDLADESTDRPKDSDFVHWAELVADAVAQGRRNAALRSYLKSAAKKAWDYAAWLTHARNANRIDAELAVDIVDICSRSSNARSTGVSWVCPIAAPSVSPTAWLLIGDSMMTRVGSSKRRCATRAGGIGRWSRCR
jgi:hypothetical protein